MTRPVDHLRTFAYSVFMPEQIAPVVEQTPYEPEPNYPPQEVPRHPGLDADYQDMTPGGVHKSAEMTMTKPTLDFLINTMMAAERQRILNVKNLEAANQPEQAKEQHAMARGFLIYMLRETQDYYAKAPEDTEITLIEEPARQARMFVGESAAGKTPGLAEDDIRDLTFLNTIMNGLNQVPPLEAGQPVAAQLGENKYETMDKVHHSGNTSQAA